MKGEKDKGNLDIQRKKYVQRGVGSNKLKLHIH
jgi:hypothetical protein